MTYIILETPPFPYYAYSGDALYRPGDFHRKRSGIHHFNLLFVEYGELYMRVDGCLYPVGKHDALIIPPGSIHEAYDVCKEKTYFHWLHFNTSNAYRLSDSFGNDLKLHKDTLAKNGAAVLVCPIWQTVSDASAPNLIQDLTGLETLSVNKYLQNALTSKASGHNTPLREQEKFLAVLSRLVVNDKQADQDIAFMLMQYLQANYATKITLQEMAKVAHCHPTHVIRCFNKKYNITPAKALLNIRLQQAEKLLQATHLSCEEISYKVGFSSASYFSKLFKRQRKLTPQDYRKAHLK